MGSTHSKQSDQALSHFAKIFATNTGMDFVLLANNILWQQKIHRERRHHTIFYRNKHDRILLSTPSLNKPNSDQALTKSEILLSVKLTLELIKIVDPT